MLRGEMNYGTALVTDVTPKTLQDYEDTSLESLEADPANITIPHQRVKSLVLRKAEPKVSFWNFPVRLTMKRQGHEVRVYNFEMNYRDDANRENSLRFHMVPLGMYFKPRRIIRDRAAILQDYAMEALRIFESVLPLHVIVNSSQPDQASQLNQ